MKAVKVKIPNKAGCGCNNISVDSCCSQKPSFEDNFVSTGLRDSTVKITQVSTKLSFNDVLGTIKARLGINRMNYKVEPGLYRVGDPDNTSPVLVTANYKMSFDSLRKELGELDAYILVLDTKGINVWCAAGKGTFGTDELIKRIEKVNLKSLVSHRNLILPQLGAPGISAHIIQKQSGFKVIYGPVRAKDLRAFIDNDFTASKAMRKVEFTLWDRLVLTPIEFISCIKSLIILFGVLFILNSIGFGHYTIFDLFALLGAVFIGSVITPALLPFILGRAFAFKGYFTGLLWAITVILINRSPGYMYFSLIKEIAYILVLPSISSFIAMNFTGCSTYTSLSGVNREMKVAVPVMITSTGLGIILIIIDSIIKIFS